MEDYTFAETGTFEPIGYRHTHTPLFESVDIGAIKQGNILPNHTNFIRFGKNLFDKSVEQLNRTLRPVAATGSVNGSDYELAN